MNDDNFALSALFSYFGSTLRVSYDNAASRTEVINVEIDRSVQSC